MMRATLILAAVLAGCSPGEPAPGSCGADDKDQQRCADGRWVETCDGAEWTRGQDCDASGMVCSATGAGLAECKEDQETCAEPKGQSALEHCCPAHGIEACAAGLFCMDFAGLSTPQCVSEGSQTGRSPCREDRHCASRSCNLQQGKCRDYPGVPCLQEIGCAPDDQGNRHLCSASGTCVQIGNGTGGTYCELPADCLNGTCSNQICLANLGGACSIDTSQPECADGFCKFCAGGGYYAYCEDSTHETECLRPCRWNGADYWQPACWDGAECSAPSDCESGNCTGGTCVARIGDGCHPETAGTPCAGTGECRSCEAAACNSPGKHVAECL